MIPSSFTSPLVRAKLAAVRRREALVKAGIGLAQIALSAAGIMAVLMALDWRYDLPRPARAVLLGSAGIGLLIAAWQWLVRPLRHRLNEDAAALRVEGAFPDFEGRLIATVQLTRPGAMHDVEALPFLRALVAQTEALIASRDLSAVIPTDRLQWWGVAVLAGILTGAAAYARGGEWSRALVQRVFLSAIPLPHQTRVICLTGDQTVGQGTTVELAARVEGIVPATGIAQLRYASGRTVEFPLERQDRTFRQTIHNVQESFSYRFALNDGQSGPHKINVVALPVVLELRCREEFPLYTRTGAVERPPTDLTLLAGSRLMLAVRASKPIARGVVRLIGLDREVPLDRSLTATVPIPAAGLTGVSIRLVDVDGVASGEEPVYPVSIRADQPPKVTLAFPSRREGLVTPRADVTVGVEAADDFGVARLVFHAQVGEEAGTATAVELDLAGTTPTRLRRQWTWQLPTVLPRLQVDDIITYWIEAEDNNNVTGPGRATSEQYALRVVSDDAKRAELLTRLEEELNEVAAIAREQERLNRLLGDLIFGRETADAPLEE